VIVIRPMKPLDPLRLVTELMSIPAGSGRETPVADYILWHLKKAGVPDRFIRRDTAHRRSHIGGECGNLIVALPGTMRGPRRMLMAHMDTVPLCVGARPRRRGDRFVPVSPKTALGSDDRSGCAIMLWTITELLRRGVPHPPVTFLWCVQEEIGLVGARYVEVHKLGGPTMAFNFDGGGADKLILGATGADRLTIEIHGVPSHAGVHPERGVSAIAAAALAVAELHRDGWHGAVRKGRSAGTSNVGVVRGGEATNVVTDHVLLKAEARSHDPRFRRRIVAAFSQAFERAARSVRNASGQHARVKFQVLPSYESFRLKEDAPVVRAAAAALIACGQKPVFKISDGGLDANWMTRHGIPTITLGAGQHNIHTVDEYLDIEEFLAACTIGLHLAAGPDPGR
jgi:tripeptide aminopeptidase